MGPELPPSVSAPATYRGILAEVRAPLPPRRQGHLTRGHNQPIQTRMSRRVRRPIQHQDWIPKITVGERQDGSSSAPGSDNASRTSSRSTHKSADDPSPVSFGDNGPERTREREPDRDQILHDE